MKTISIHQPSYWPWLGLCHKVANSDVFVILDTVDLNKEAYQHRNQFLCNGKKQMLTIPITYSLGTPIKDIKIADRKWGESHYNKLLNWYRNSRFFGYYHERIKELYRRPFTNMIEPVIETMKFIFNELGINTEIIHASCINPEGKKAELVLDICKKLKADLYLSGRGALNYMGDDAKSEFEKANIKIELQNFTHPTYEQFNSQEFIPGLAALDLLFNHGPNEAKNIFRQTLEK